MLAALQCQLVKLGLRQWETAMVVLGELLIVGGSAIVVASAIFLGLAVLQTKAIAWTG